MKKVFLKLSIVVKPHGNVKYAKLSFSDVSMGLSQNYPPRHKKMLILTNLMCILLFIKHILIIFAMLILNI